MSLKPSASYSYLSSKTEDGPVKYLKISETFGKEL